MAISEEKYEVVLNYTVAILNSDLTAEQKIKLLTKEITINDQIFSVLVYAYAQSATNFVFEYIDAFNNAGLLEHLKSSLKTTSFEEDGIDILDEWTSKSKIHCYNN